MLKVKDGCVLLGCSIGVLECGKRLVASSMAARENSVELNRNGSSATWQIVSNPSFFLCFFLSYHSPSFGFFFSRLHTLIFEFSSFGGKKIKYTAKIGKD